PKNEPINTPAITGSLKIQDEVLKVGAVFLISIFLGPITIFSDYMGSILAGRYKEFSDFLQFMGIAYLLWGMAVILWIFNKNK
ncbi:MAG: hypothetical protein HQK79_22595, partial [Desulfobacterales bacterium]|nr:hypothetical protein [Desulfobacterales bacterium]